MLPETVCAGNPDAKRLYDDLLSNYNKLVRPVVNVTDALTVRIKLKLSQLIDVVRVIFHFFTGVALFLSEWNKHEMCINANVFCLHSYKTNLELEKSDYDVESVGGAVMVWL